MALKIALVGAGSRSFGRRTVQDIFLSDPLCSRDLELVLMDIVPDHLTDIAERARRVANAVGRTATVTTTTDLDAALEGASFVVTAIEVNRYLYWSQDFHIPRKYGFRQIYGENGGIGGIFHALRNMGPMVEIARTMERLCPDAVLLNFANPEHKLCEAVSRLTSIRCVGLCHGVLGGKRQIASILGMSADDIEGEACGINHFTWFQTIRDRRTGEDLYPRLREREREGDALAHWHELALGRVLLRRFGLWPSPGTNHYGEYIRWAEEFMASQAHFYYDPADGPPWETGRIPEFVYYLGRVDTDRPWSGQSDPEPQHVEPDELAFSASGELAVPIMEGVACDVRRSLAAINVPNRGSIPNLPDDLVVEVPGTSDASGVRASQMAPLPEPIAALIRTQASIHKLIVEAFTEESKDKLLQAILLEPTVDSYRRAVDMMEEMLRLQRDLLPALR